MAVKNVKIFNRNDCCSGRLTGAKVSLIDNAGKYLDTFQIGDARDIIEFDINFASPTGEPLLTSKCKTRLGALIKSNQTDLLDSSIALAFGNGTTIGQVCSFSKGLTSRIVTNIPGFCCLDAPYQSTNEEWGEKVSSWGCDDERKLILRPSSKTDQLGSILKVLLPKVQPKVGWD